MVLDGIVDAGGGQHGIELAPGGGGVVLGEDGFDDGLFGQCFARFGCLFAVGLAIRLVVVDMEAQHVAVFDGVGDGVGVQLLLEDVCRGLVAGLLALDLLIAGVLIEDGRTSEAEQLGVGEKLLDRLVVLAKLRAVAFVENEHHALVAQWLQALLVVALVATVECQTELLDGGDDHLIGVVIGEQAAHQRFGVGVFLHAAFLKLVEFLAGLPVEVFAIHHEQTFVDVGVVFQQGRGFERGQRFAAAGGVPDVAIAAALVDAFDNRLDRIDLIRAHHQ